ncbi:MAG: hypothetical protein AVDCRST_MAG10-3643, partial [uncultured Acidimicrobiales bacterium]
ASGDPAPTAGDAPHGGARSASDVRTGDARGHDAVRGSGCHERCGRRWRRGSPELARAGGDGLGAGPRLHHRVQRADQPRHWSMGRRQPPERLEADSQPLGVVPGTAVVAAAHRLRLHLRRFRLRV